MLFTEELLAHIKNTQHDANQNVIIDLFCGSQSIKPVAMELGFKYIGVDIKPPPHYDIVHPSIDGG